MGVRARGLGRRLRKRLLDPVWWVDVVQLVKTALAAVLAWVVADRVVGSSQSFLAPWSAILVMHATVLRTASRAAQQVAMTVLGVLLAFAGAALLGVGVAALSAVALAGLAFGVARMFRAESSTAAAVAVIVLLTGAADDREMLLSRLGDTGLGIGFGLAVTVLVWPPLRDRAIVRRVADLRLALGLLLVDMANGLAEGVQEDDAEDWIDRTRRLDDDVEHGAALARQASESGRMNPRLRARRRIAGLASWAAVVDRIEQAVSDARSMVRTIQRDVASTRSWDPTFGDRWIRLLTEAGRAVEGDDGGRLAGVRVELDGLARELYERADSAPIRPLYGALIANLSNIVGAMEDVATARSGEVGAVSR